MVLEKKKYTIFVCKTTFYLTVVKIKDCVDCGKIHYEEARERFMRITEPYVAIDY